MKNEDKPNINKKSGLFFNIGLIISIGLVISAFEWKSYDDSIVIALDDSNGLMEEDWVAPISYQPPPPPPPKPTVPKFTVAPEPAHVEPPVDIEPKPEPEPDPIEFYQPLKPEKPEPQKTFRVVESMPEPDGGLEAFYKYIGKKMKYPTQARRSRIEGTVFVQFVIDIDGSITEAKVFKGFDRQCDQEALDAVKNSKKWKPGKQRGKPVRVQMVVPIIFKLT